MQDDDGSFKRVFKGFGANRHIIVDNVTVAGEAPELYDPKVFEDI